MPGLVEPLDFGRGEDVFRVHELARAGDDHVGGDGDEIVEVAVFEVELAADVGQGVPSAEVVVDAHARVPLGDVVDVALLGGTPRGAAAPHAGDGVVIADVELQRAAFGGERLGEPDLHAGVVDEVLGGVVTLAEFDLDRVELEARGGAAAGIFFVVGDPATAGLAAVGELGAGVLAVDVLFHEDPQAGERIGAVVGVGDDLVVAQHLGLRVERGVHFVVGFILPVARAGCAVA